MTGCGQVEVDRKLVKTVSIAGSNSFGDIKININLRNIITYLWNEKRNS